MSHHLTEDQLGRLCRAVQTLTTPTIDALFDTLVEDDGDEALLDVLDVAKRRRADGYRPEGIPALIRCEINGEELFLNWQDATLEQVKDHYAWAEAEARQHLAAIERGRADWSST